MITRLIFFFLTLVMAVGSLAATADPGDKDNDEVQSKDPTKQVQNLIFYPHKSEYRFNPELVDQLGYTERTYDSTGTETTSATESYYEITVGYAYGITNRWRAGVTETYLLDKTTTKSTVATGDQTNTAAEGLSDPTLSTAYRYLQNFHRGVFADFVLTVTPEVSEKYLATANQTGNNFAGGWSASASLPFYGHSNRNEFGVVPTLTHGFGSSGNAVSHANSTETSPYTQFTLMAEDRFHFNRDFFLQLNTQYNFAYSFDITTLGSGAVSHHNPNGNLSESIVIGYLEDIHTSLMLTVTLDSASGGTDNTTTKTQQATANIDVYMYYF